MDKLELIEQILNNTDLESICRYNLLHTLSPDIQKLADDLQEQRDINYDENEQLREKIDNLESKIERAESYLDEYEDDVAHTLDNLIDPLIDKILREEYHNEERNLDTVELFGDIVTLVDTYTQKVVKATLKELKSDW